MGVDCAIDITSEQRRTILTLLERYLPSVETWVYGSRAKWTSRPDSDLDLAVFATPKQKRWVGDLREAFEISDLPFRVDLFVWDDMPEAFREKIEADHVVLVERSKSKTPEVWPNLLLGDCIEMNDTSYVPSEAWSFINYLDTGNIKENHISEIQYLIPGKDKIPSRAKRKVRPGDIVYSTVRPNQRHFGILRTVPKNFLASTGFSVIRAKSDIACTDFVYWFLTQESIVDLLQTIGEHSTSAYPSIKPSDIEELEIDLPAIPEQRAIAHILSTLDDKIELNRRMNETLEAMARALFKSWFVDFDPVRAKMAGCDPGLPQPLINLFPDRLVDSELGEIPEGWEVSMIGDEVNAVGGGTPNTREPAYWNGGIHNWATPKDLSRLASPVLLETERKITDAGVKKISSGLLPVGSVLLSSRAPIGYLAIAEQPVAINQGFIAMICENRLPNVFVLYWCYENLAHIRRIAGGSTFSEISKKVFRPILVAIPSRKILKVYEDVVSPLYDRIVTNTKEAELLAQTRDILLPRLVSGEIRLNDAERSLEAVL